MAPVCLRIRRTGAGRRAAPILAAAALTCLLCAPVGATAKVKPWPPAAGSGELFVHFGEEHINDADGATLLPKVVRQSARYRPRLVTMSGDKADNGEAEQFELWSEVMRIYDDKEIPWFAGVGNHDRTAPPGFPGGVATVAAFDAYSEFFADRPYPMGDAPGYAGGIQPKQRGASDPDGASSHYFADVAGVRWIFIDNSCWSIVQCDPLQHPSGQNEGGSEAQFDFLERVGKAASEDGKLVFVVMHMPTRDPGDQTYREPTAVMHTMGKTAGGVLDNSLFEQTAVAAGVDGVFVGHIKGQFLYTGAGEIPYFVDGGAGGELYTTGPIGTDHGYWHGYRLIRVRGRFVRHRQRPDLRRRRDHDRRGEGGRPGREANLRSVRPPTGLQRPGDGPRARASRPRSRAPLGSHRRRRMARARGPVAGAAGAPVPACRARAGRGDAAAPPPGGSPGARHRARRARLRRRLRGPAERADFDPGRVVAQPGQDVDELDAAGAAPGRLRHRRRAPQRSQADRRRHLPRRLPRSLAADDRLRVRAHQRSRSPSRARTARSSTRSAAGGT